MNFKEIENHWQKVWEKEGIYKTKDLPAQAGKKNYMLLTEFPYPSGNLHIGHWYAFAVPDILGRFLRMNGKNVSYPIGFDAFGLPAENAAIKRKINPRDWTEQNIKYMTNQLKSMGAAFDWDRLVSTIDPEYYKWTQWIFLKFYEKGLAYRAKTLVNWCPKDKTVLANEQVVNGLCERCDTPVVQKEFEQWMFKTTAYADRLIDDIESLDWPQTTKLAQKNWIGRSEGALVKFPIDVKIKKSKETFKFRPYLVPLVLSGEKYITYRLEPKKVKVGDVCEFYNWTTKEKFALARITKIEKKKMKDVSEKEDGHEKFKTRKEFYDTYSRYYKTKVIDDTDIWLYHFELVPEHIEVFTTRVDTIFGCTYVVVAPEVLANGKWQIANSEEVEKYIKEAKRKSELERMTEDKQKTGVELKGIKAINPFTNKEVPVFIADYVLGHYGTGAVMAVPAHDERDWEFAKKYKLPIKMVICPNYPEPKCPILDKAYVDDGHLVDSGKFTGMTSEKARQEMSKWLKEKNLGGPKKTYKLHDWVLSRQRYWGVPIPMVKCADCGYVPVKEKDLPVKLPKLDNFLPTSEGKSPLAKVKKWVAVKCPQCGKKAERETDTMDTFVDSSWYFIRYTDPGNKKKFAAPKKMKSWLPVPMYVGGAEHNTMHLLYSRFFTKALYDLGLVNFNEPFIGRRNHGVILGPDNQKMSKSRGNVVDPDREVANFGADCVRMYLAFMGPYDQGGPWNPTGILGIKRFLDRIFSFAQKLTDSQKLTTDNKELEKLLHKTIKKVGEDIENFRFNTAISALMILLNEIEKEKEISLIHYSKFLILLSSFAPFLTEEIWRGILKNKKSIHLEKWPKYDSKLIVENKFKLIVQINGKFRDSIEAGKGISEKEAKQTALNSEKIKTLVGNKEIKKVIYVKDRLINIVL